ncbi:MAG: DUF2207 domain-containing protein, partial [Tepidiformaceae bacterium]
GRAWAARTLVAVAVVAVAVVCNGGRAQAQEGGTWRITSFTIDYAIERDGTAQVAEDVVVDFGELQRHGIFRELIERVPCGDVAADEAQPLYPCPGGSDRLYKMDQVTVTDHEGTRLDTQITHEGGRMLIRIGDADVLVSGVHTYRISYRLRGALNAFATHAELFWNASGVWPEAYMEQVRISVTLPAGAMGAAACYIGAVGSRERCEVRTAATAVCLLQAGQSPDICRERFPDATATFTSQRRLFPGEQITIAASWPAGLVEVPPPLLDDRPSPDDYFALDGAEWGGAGATGLLAFGLLGRAWWRNGRDRKYRSIYYLTNDPSEHTRPLFARDPVVVEYTPPEDLRPAEMGVLLDERADTLDVTATIIDLAVRGHLHITEIPKKGWFGKTDWLLTRTGTGPATLAPFEATVSHGLFGGKTEVKMSDLKNKFYEDLAKARKQLYKAVVTRKWFKRSPETVRPLWAVAGVAVAVLGVVLSVLAGLVLGRALIGFPVALAGLVLLLLSRAMPRRTATGSEALRRILGFRLYVATAETRRQQFNEQKQILDDFARYLPYAMVFGCVGRWAKAFEGLEGPAQAATSAWYTGSAPFRVAAFSSGMHSFASTVSSTITSTPGSSGGSGFGGGGGSGGGGGGGGGGSW